jgi:hypothetical protein
MADCRPSNNRLMTREELAPWILRRLGAPIWKIEVCNEHILDAIEQAIRWFAAKKGVYKLFTIQMVSSQVEYDLDCEIDTVLDVAPTTQKMDLTLIFSPFTLLEEKIPYDVFASGGSGGLYSSYVQALQYIKTAKRVLSADFEWYQINQKLFIAPPPANSLTMIVTAKVNFTRIEDLKERDHELIKRYALAKAMQDLAWVRGKYGEYPGAQGTLTMNWDRLLDWADTEVEKLNEEIMDSAGPLGMLTG